MGAGWAELDRVITRYAATTLTLLFVVIGPATADRPAPPGPAGVQQLDGRQGADGEDPERTAPHPPR